MGIIRFFSEKTPFTIPHPRKTSNWIKRVISKEGKELNSLNVIFCSDRYLLKMNAEYLNHKTLTDILTFDHSEATNSIEGDIFISIQRVKENAIKFNSALDSELHRVIVHGVLHLMGYNDKTPHQKLKMRNKEDSYLSLR